MARIRVETAKISTLISKDLYDRLSQMCDVSGMTMSAAIQVCLSVGCGTLEPSMLATLNRNVSNNEEMLSYFKSEDFILKIVETIDKENKKD